MCVGMCRARRRRGSHALGAPDLRQRERHHAQPVPDQRHQPRHVLPQLQRDRAVRARVHERYRCSQLRQTNLRASAGVCSRASGAWVGGRDRRPDAQGRVPARVSRRRHRGLRRLRGDRREVPVQDKSATFACLDADRKLSGSTRSGKCQCCPFRFSALGSLVTMDWRL